MVDRPILFSSAMVRALLANRKTQTRRVIKPTSEMDGFTMYPQYLNGERIGSSSDPSFWDLSEFAVDPAKGLYGSAAPYCPRDRLYVRETFARLPRTAYALPKTVDPADPDMAAYYRADFDRSGKPPWKPGIHMPRWASRLTLTVTDVRVQRLQEISHDDAVAEGVGIFPHSMSAQKRYRELWDSLNADRGFGWEANPWIVAVTFTVERRNIDAVD